MHNLSVAACYKPGKNIHNVIVFLRCNYHLRKLHRNTIKIKANILIAILVASSVPALAQEHHKKYNIDDTVVAEVPLFYTQPATVQKASFDGDMDDFIYAHLNYPKSARAAGKHGIVLVEAFIDTAGYVTGARVRHSVYPSLDSEALRIVWLMPRFTPYKQNGIPRAVTWRVNVPFMP